MKELPGYCGDVEPMRIVLKPEWADKPIFEPPCRHSDLEYDIQDDKFGEIRDAAISEPATSTKYACNCTMPAKKAADGSWTKRRLCFDARRINEATEADRHPLPLSEELFRSMAGSRFFTAMDLRYGFFQLQLAVEDRPKTAVWWRSSLWQMTRVSFGGRQATGDPRTNRQQWRGTPWP
jgi:hypothetical protein